MRPHRRYDHKNVKLNWAKNDFSSHYKYRSYNLPTHQTSRKRYFVIEKMPNKKYTITYEHRVCYTRASNKQMRHYEQRNANLFERLPHRQLEEILRYLNVWHYKRIRDASQFFQQLHDDYLVHMFSQAVQTAKKKFPTRRTTIKLTTLEAVTIHYMQAGYAHSFSGCLLPLLRHCYEHPFRLDVASLARFIIHFLQIVDEQVRLHNKYVGVLLYTMTFLRIFMLFPNKTIIFGVSEGDKSMVHFELSGSWNFIMSSLDKCSSNQRKRNSLIMILAKILIACKSGRSFEKNKYEIIVNCQSDVETQVVTPVSHTYFNLLIDGSPYISSIVKDVADGAEYIFRWPVEPLEKNFALSLEIFSDDVGKLGSNRRQVIDITNA